MSILVVGAGRIGQRITKNYNSLNMQTTNISSRLAHQIQGEPLSDLLSNFDTIVWCGRDAGTHSNKNNSRDKFHEVLKLILIKNWSGYFVYLSSAGDVYGEFRGWAFSEEDDPHPITNYGKLKLEHENDLLMVASTVKMKVLIARVSNIYDLSESDTGIVGAILRGLNARKIVTIEGGHQTRDFVHLDDVIKTLGELTIQHAEGIFNIVSGVSFSIDQIQHLLELKYADKLLVERSEFSRKIVDSKVSNSKLGTYLNWKPKPINEYISAVCI